MYRIIYRIKNKKLYNDDMIKILNNIKPFDNNLYNNSLLLYKQTNKKYHTNTNNNNNYLPKIIDETHTINNNENNIITNIFGSIMILYSIIIIYK